MGETPEKRGNGFPVMVGIALALSISIGVAVWPGKRTRVERRPLLLIEVEGQVRVDNIQGDGAFVVLRPDSETAKERADKIAETSKRLERFPNSKAEFDRRAAALRGAGVAGPDGKFRITYVVPNDGIRPGRYFIEITWPGEKATTSYSEQDGWKTGNTDKLSGKYADGKRNSESDPARWILNVTGKEPERKIVLPTFELSDK